MIPYVKIFLGIKKIVSTKRTGALFVSTDSNRLAKIFFNRGQIASITLNRKNGLAACVEFRSIGSGKMKFHEGISDNRDETLPETVHILGILKPAGLASQTSDLNKVDTTTGQKMVDMIREAFIAVVGPIGEVLFEDELAVSKNISDLIDRLTKEMTSPEDISNFKARLQS